MSAKKRIAFDLGNKIRVSPSLWPGPELAVQPGDLTKFVPYGNGVYGYQNHKGDNPFMIAPQQEPRGGVIYFENDIKLDDFDALMRIMRAVPVGGFGPSKDFAVFATEFSDPRKEGFLAQLRIVPKFGLRFLFEAIAESEYDSFPEQELTIAEVIWSFIEFERNRWGTSFSQDEQMGLRGLFGGDGNFAREELSFGLMLENDYYHIFRIWSRAWLVTK